MYLKTLCALALISQVVALTVADFKPALFHSSKPSGFYVVNTGPQIQGKILSFGDLNGDKYTDYIATNDLSSPSLSFYFWNEKQSSFSVQNLATLSTSNYSIAEAMISKRIVYTGDIDSDGLAELVITYTSNAKYHSEVYAVRWQNQKCNIERKDWDYTKLSEMTAVPFLIDITGYGDLGFFAFFGSNRRIVQYDPRQTGQLKSYSWQKYVRKSSGNFNLVSRHFASNIDFNGDCIADLVIVSNDPEGNNNIIQFYQKGESNLYEQLTPIKISQSIEWLSFADLDANGAIDIHYISRQNDEYIPSVILNIYSPSDICIAFPSFPFKAANAKKMKIPSQYKFIFDTNPKFADFNFDGLPDILGIFSVDEFKKASILLNKGQLTFSPFVEQNSDQFYSINNPVQACIFDFTQNGKIDLLIISQVTKQNGSIAFVRTSVVNNIIEDTLFIKILPLLATSSSDFESSLLNSATGVTIQWRITNLDGDKTISLLNQKYQWNYGSLQLPFVTIGLGRTNNYIEDLTVGYSGMELKQAWTPIIPNSQLVVKPNIGSDWQLQTLLRDNSRVYEVIYISIICLLFLGLVVFYLNWRETQQDKRDHYNFIQMIR